MIWYNLTANLRHGVLHLTRVVPSSYTGKTMRGRVSIRQSAVHIYYAAGLGSWCIKLFSYVMQITRDNKYGVLFAAKSLHKLSVISIVDKVLCVLSSAGSLIIISSDIRGTLSLLQ